VDRPVRVIIYGSPGAGKTTFGADAPSPIFLPVEEGTNQLDVARFPKPETWGDALSALDSLIAESHVYKTLVIDTLDSLEPLCWAHTCATKVDKNNKRHDSIESFPFGDGYVKAADEWRNLTRRLDAVREKGVSVVLIAHSHVKTYKSPDTDDYERYELKINKQAAPVLTEWADAVLFARFEVLTRKVGDRGERYKAVASDLRVMHTQDATAFYAKNRYGLPPTLPLGWQPFADAVAAGRAMPATESREQISDLLRDQSEALRERVNAAVAKAGEDGPTLAKILNQLRATVAPKEKSA
jgi:hypothetical protein